MVRNGPLAPRGGSSWLRFLPLGKGRNRRLRTPVRKAMTPAATASVPGTVARAVEADATDRTGPPQGMTEGGVVEAAASDATRPSELTRPSKLAASMTPPVTQAVQRRARPQKKRDWKGILRGVSLVATIAALVGGAWGGHRWLTRSPHFAIREIRVSPTKHIDADALRARTGIDIGDNLFTADLGAAARELAAEPWVQRVEVRRELPGTVAVDVTEREPACVVALGALYLADQNGVVFKRANIDEAASLPVVTGVPRDGYIDDREHSQALIREALAGLGLWRDPRPAVFGGGTRPPIGEIHVDAAFGVTLYTVHDGVGVRLGRGDAAALRDRLRRVDAVWAQLGATRERPRMILVGNRADRVTVKLAN